MFVIKEAGLGQWRRRGGEGTNTQDHTSIQLASQIDVVLDVGNYIVLQAV